MRNLDRKFLSPKSELALIFDDLRKIMVVSRGLKLWLALQGFKISQ